MPETMIVLGVLMIMASIAIPQMLGAIYKNRIRGAATDLSGLIQTARTMALRRSIYLAIYAGNVGGGADGAFINCSPTSCPTGGNGATYQAGDADVSYTPDVKNGYTTSAGFPGVLSPGFTPDVAGTILYFNPQGQATKFSGSAYSLSSGVVFYIMDGHGNWAAVSATASGQSKVWKWDGSEWK